MKLVFVVLAMLLATTAGLIFALSFDEAVPVRNAEQFVSLGLVLVAAMQGVGAWFVRKDEQD